MSTKIVMILDRSGSMSNLASDVLGGFNQFLKEQKEVKGKATLLTVLFDDKYEILHDGLDIKDIEPITEKEYFVRGTTALWDAVGKTITAVKSKAKKRDKILFFINTDGFENASIEYNAVSVKALVEECKKLGWNFVFIGANIDSFAVGGSVGINLTANYSPTTKGTTSVYLAMSDMTTSYRNSSSNVVDSEKLKDIQ